MRAVLPKAVRVKSAIQFWSAVMFIDRQLVIAIGGATASGKTRAAEFLARQLGIYRIISTDYVRVMMYAFSRNTKIPVNRKLRCAALRVGKSAHETSYESLDAVEKRRIVINGYLDQVKILSTSLSAIVTRSRYEEKPIIIEGIHIYPDEIQHWPTPVVPIYLSISDISVHLTRLECRANELFRSERATRTLEHCDEITEIRWIHDHIIERAKVFTGSFIVTNDSSVEKFKQHLIAVIRHQNPT
jgi:2-phosphoglycerate kinase